MVITTMRSEICGSNYPTPYCTKKTDYQSAFDFNQQTISASLITNELNNERICKHNSTVVINLDVRKPFD